MSAPTDGQQARHPAWCVRCNDLPEFTGHMSASTYLRMQKGIAWFGLRQHDMADGPKFWISLAVQSLNRSICDIDHVDFSPDELRMIANELLAVVELTEGGGRNG